MESVLRRTEVELGTLINPPTKQFSVFSSYAPRRSHLDSESYRSLVRILSHCVEHSPVPPPPPPPPPPERAIYVRNPTSSHERCEVHLELEEGANINDETPMERHKEGSRCADDGEQDGSLVSAIELPGFYDFDDKIEKCVNTQLLSQVMSDCKRIIDAPNGDLCLIGKSYERNRQVDLEESVDTELDIPKAQILGATEGVSDLGEVSEVAKEDANGELLNNVITNVGRLIDVPIRELYWSGHSYDVNGQASHEDIVNIDLENPKACVYGIDKGFSNIGEVSEVAKDDVNCKMLSQVIPACGRSNNDAPDGELHSSGESHKGNEQAAHVKVAEIGSEITKACVYDAEEGVLNIEQVSAAAKEDANSKLLSKVISNCGRLIDLPNGELHWTSESHEGKGQSSHEVIVNNNLEIEKTCIHGAEEGISYIGEVSKFAKEDVNCELLNSVILDCRRLIDAPSGELQSSDCNGQTGHLEIVDNDIKISKPCVHGAEEGISNIGEVSEVAKGDELDKVQSDVSEVRVCSSMKEVDDKRERVADVGKLVSSEPRKGTNDKIPFLDETRDENSKGVEEKSQVTEQLTYFHSTSLTDCSEIKILEEDQVNTSTQQIDEGEFEEGEIPDEIQDLEGLIDINDKERVEGSRRFDFNEAASSTTYVHKKEVLELGTGYNPSIVEGNKASVDYEANISDASEKDSTDEETPKKQMVMKTREKKQRTHLTEERKAKKKIAKKRKRAQKNREQGVKKLKLHAVMKPKEIKICNFYLKGRCQQGDLCKYSHDTPLEKTVPCKYFACNSCLKGDDCPYDHDLSKYPCHKYASTGNCIRGDGCKFSHKIQSTDASSQLTCIKVDSGSTSEQSKLRTQPILAHVSPLDKGSFESYNKDTPSLRHKPLKEVNQVPKGIRFLSFGAVHTDLTNNVKESLPAKKPGHNGAYSLQRQDDLFVNGYHHNAFVVSSGLLGDASSNGFAVKDSGNITKGFSIASPETVNHEVSEATKILEEFLFCGPS